MFKKIFSLAIIISMVVFAFAQKGYVNPAAKYCEILGYNYEVANIQGVGDIGMVTLPDGNKVNAWDFYKGKVGQEFSYAAKYGYTVVTETQKIDGYTVETPMCVKTIKGIQEKIPMEQLMSQHGDNFYSENEDFINLSDYVEVDPDFEVSKTIPTSFDWRNYNGHAYIGNPRDQGSCGSCYAFGASACAEGTYNVATGSYDGNTADFAESYIVWCLSSMSDYSSHFGGCDGADYEYMELQALVDIGTIPESYFPYSQSTSQSCPSTATNAPKTKFASWYRVPCSDEDAIKTAIMTYGVVDAAVYVSTSFSNYSGGVYTDSYTSCNGSPCSYTTTNHAIALVGWGHDATYGDYWILRNSWGSSWGEGGYMRLAVNAARVDCSVCYMTYQSATPTTPTATTVAASGISTSGATLNGTVNNNNASSTTVTFEYGTTTSYGSTKTATPSSVTGSSNTSVSATLTGLNSNTTYHYRVKAVNSVGTKYGSDMTFTTSAQPTAVNLPLAENFNASSMPSGWTTSNTGTGITERWSVSNTANAGGSAYEMKCTYLNVNPATTMLITPALNTNGMSSIILNSKYMFDDYGAGATIKVQVSSNGTTWTDVPGWSLTSASNANHLGTITDLSVPVSGSVSYVAFVVTGNLYQIDNFYVDNVSITATSSASLATVTTTSASSITSTGATTGGNVTADGGASVTERGVCYSTSSNPTTSNSKVTSGTGTGSFSCNLTGLSSSTTYYARAYAINSVGTAYGSQISFTTSTGASLPTATTVAASGISTNGATLNGTVNNNNATSTTVTFEYGTTTSYGSTKTATPSSVTGSSNTSVYGTLTGLAANTTYHFRVKAVNSVGTKYGNDLTFTTLSTSTGASLPFAENFNASTLPTGWTTSNTGTGITERWSVSNTNKAGGVAYEMKCSYQSVNPGTTRLITPALNTAGLSNVLLNAKYLFDDYGAGATIKVQVSSNGTTWSDVSGWSLTSASNANHAGSITDLSVPVSGSATYIAFVVTGNLYQIDYFYVDNVTVTAPVGASAPSATTITASSVTSGSATLNGTINNNNASSTTVTFEYGTTTSYGSTKTATPTSVTGSSNTSVSAALTGLSANTTYHFRVKATNSVGTSYGSDMSFVTDGNTIVYCASSGNSVTYEWLDYFALGTLSNTTGANGGYGDFTSMTPPSLGLGSSQTVYFSGAYKSTAYTEYYKVYIDYNHDGDFTDAGETVASGSSTSTGTLSATFTIPTSALIGTTRCRIVMSDNSGTTSCGSYSYGETEDYTVNITGNSSSKGSELYTQTAELEANTAEYLTLYPIPAYDFITVKIQSNEVNATASIVSTNGKIVKIQELNSNKQIIDVSDLAPGAYSLIYDDDAKKYIKVFVKQ